MRNYLSKALNKVKKINKKEFLIIFILLLLPNWLRHLAYYVGILKTGGFGFIISYETKQMYDVNAMFLGLLEEVVFSLLFTTLFLGFNELRFLAYAWVFDSFYDCTQVLIYSLTGFTFLSFINLPILTRFIIRELLLPYVIAGPIIAKAWKPNIKKYAVIGFFINLFLIFLTLIF